MGTDQGKANPVPAEEEIGLTFNRGITPVKVCDWIRILNKPPPKLLNQLQQIYGDSENSEHKRRIYTNALQVFGDTYGFDAEVIIARSPGRINVMGRHVDYLGGYANPMGTNLETIALGQARSDRRVHLKNMNPKFKEKSFFIDAELPKEKIRDLDHWDKWTAERFREKQNSGEELGWDEYVKGLLVYLQDAYRKQDGSFTKSLKGMNILITSDLPIERALSSSSALVTSVALVTIKLNDLKMPLTDFVERIGYSEWYRLTRGGSADHAAIMLARRDKICHIGSLPMRMNEISYAPFPENYAVVIASSGIKRPQDDYTRNYLRVTAAAYRIAVLLTKSFHPRYAGRITWLRDITTRNLGISLSHLYEILKSLPERRDRSEIRESVAKRYCEELEVIFSNHEEPPQGYKIRQMAMYGLAEAERAQVFPQLLVEGNMADILKLIRCSHDGDRVAKFDQRGNQLRWDPGAFSSDEALDRLLSILRNPSLTPEELERSQLFWQPGGYERSIQQIDRMCDLVAHNLGDCGAAQLMGAGLGGDVEIAIRRDRIEDLRKLLLEHYYEPFGIHPEMTIIATGEGACVLARP